MRHNITSLARALGCVGIIGDAGSAGAIALVAVVTSAACVGAIGDPGNGGGGGGGAGAGADAGGEGGVGVQSSGPCVTTLPARRVWPLSRIEYDQSVAASLGDTSNQAEKTFTPDNRANGYTSNEAAMVVDPTVIYQLMTAAEQIAANVGPAQLAALSKSCMLATQPTAATPDPCAMQYIQSRGKQVYRRPLTSGEETRLYDVYLTGFQNPDPGVQPSLSAIQSVIATMVYSPDFLYRTELGDPADTTSSTVSLTQYEVANAISYAASGAPPDEALMALADGNGLGASATDLAQYQRLASTASGRSRISEFVMEWLAADQASLSANGGTVSASIVSDMTTETQQTVQNAVFSGSGKLSELLTADYTFLNSELASYYGLPAPPGAGFSKVALGGAQGRAGILSQGSFLVTSAGPGVQPIHRGHILVNQVLCEQLPSFASVGLPGFTPPPFMSPSPGTTTREEVSKMIVKGSICDSCHEYFTPMGFGLENFDATGKYRTTDNGGMVDPSGLLRQSTNIDPATGTIRDITHYTDTTFADFKGLAQALSTSDAVSGCFAHQIATYTSGRDDLAGNDCAVRALQTSFSKSGGDILGAFGAYVQSPQFSQRSR